MELRRMTIFIALFVLAYVAQCSEARHAMKRQIDDVNYDDVLADEASDDEAQNDDGGNDADEDIEVMAEIVTKPKSYNATIGDTIRLECAYTPDGGELGPYCVFRSTGTRMKFTTQHNVLMVNYTDNGVVVRWTKNNNMYFMGTKKPVDFSVNLNTNDDRFSIAANSTDLVIRDVTPADSGEYKCEIQQSDYPSVQHTVNVLERPKIVRLTASDGGKVVEGKDLVLTCEVEGSPPPQILWSREVEQGNKRLQEKDGEFKPNSVLIKNVNKHHSGKYYCYAFNSIGHNQKDVEVTVMGKPRVHVHKYVINSAINVEAVLECSVRDHLASYIRWYKDDVPIEESSRQYTIRTQGQNSTLTITPKADADFGTFTCEAENDLGKHNKSIELVQSPVVEEFGVEGPKLTWRVHSHQPVEKMEIQLRDISGDSEWQAIDVPLPERRNHQFEVIYNLMEKQLESGTYEASVRVKNDKSWSVQTDPALVEIVSNQPQLIQASVYHPGNDAYIARPTTTVLMATTFMYLLVRML